MREVEVCDERTVRDVLDQLAMEEPGFAAIVYDGERVRSGILILHNDKVADWADLSQLELREGDRLTFYPQIAGG